MQEKNTVNSQPATTRQYTTSCEKFKIMLPIIALPGIHSLGVVLLDKELQPLQFLLVVT